jgi:hypothetical protein
MRRLVLGVTAMVLAGCNVREAFTAHADEAARAGTLTLSSERLANLLAEGKNVQLNRETSDFVANLWVDYALFAQALAKGDSLTDSATVAAAMWPQLTEMRATHWHDSLMAGRSEITPEMTAAVYNGKDVRVLQHILVNFQANATPEDKATARRRADELLARAKRGDNFGQLAAQFSGDPGSKADNGFLPPSPRGRFVPSFDSAGWSLPPGGMTGLVESPFGYHIIRRPPLDEVRDRIVAFERQGLAQSLDSVYLDSLAMGNGLKVSAEAPATMRAALQDPQGKAHSKKAIAEYKGGALTQGDFLKWIAALPPQLTGQLKAAPDSALDRFAKILTTNVLLIRQADSAGVQVTPVEWEQIQQFYRFSLDSLRMEMDVTPNAFADASASESDRVKAAGLKLDTYLDEVVAGRRRLRPMPLTLGYVLRERGKWNVSDAGLNRALELARAKKSADSTKAPQPKVQVMPAPGGPPVPGGAAPAAPPAQAPAPKP